MPCREGERRRKHDFLSPLPLDLEIASQSRTGLNPLAFLRGIPASVLSLTLTEHHPLPERSFADTRDILHSYEADAERLTPQNSEWILVGTLELFRSLSVVLRY
ncbi:hypothetical protein AVEN_20080-1 [Araneus ventricosus]|uniref:Uncharacterized protein n=1 Tax=Araneus ventricosus TaxID=182803 RepID=A0A4Y2UC64_ARAVE|nr:hypothetical protein AVEN_24028-1 [Araneus ventricosus]GBO14197.1 hypothetical protein AVEN_20080-1 [Araneus ventricosus]